MVLAPILPLLPPISCQVVLVLQFSLWRRVCWTTGSCKTMQNRGRAVERHMQDRPAAWGGRLKFQAVKAPTTAAAPLEVAKQCAVAMTWPVMNRRSSAMVTVMPQKRQRP